MKDDKFKLLKKKDICEFLQGNGPYLVEYDGIEYGMPYYTGAQLHRICVDFGITDPPAGSRWEYVEALMDYSINNDRMDEMLQFFFSEERFENLKGIATIEEIDRVYQGIIVEAIKHINEIIIMSKHEISFVDGHFYINETRKAPIIETPKIDTCTTNYIQGLKARCNNDLIAGNFDSVITKSRTMMEEILVSILEENNVTDIAKGKLNEQYKQVKNLYRMQQSKDYDSRVNSLLSGLERIVQSVSEMRNVGSDAHGVGSRRISIRESEARLVMNSAITFCEYMISDHGKVDKGEQ